MSAERSSGQDAFSASADDFGACENVARREGRNFHWGFRFLPRGERDALCALYAFARRTDDIVDEEARPVEARRRLIAEWRAATADALESGRSGDAILRAVAASSRRFGMPREEFFLLIEGCEDDLAVRRYETFEETLGYCRKVAITVGYLMLAIFGARVDAARGSMAALGNAFQLTNIVRDVPEDLRRDRIYIPRREMERHGVTEAMLREGRATPRTRELLAAVADRAAACYAESEGLYQHLSSAQRKTMRAMSRIYAAILEEARRRDFDVWSSRPRVSTPRKIVIVVATSLGL